MATLVLAGCSDGATRIAFDLEGAAGDLRHSGAEHLVVKHVPKRFPEGCSGNYDVQLSAASSLLIWCKDGRGEVVASHSTTYHLRFVKVPRTWILQKRDGEPTWIELTRQGPDVVVTRAY